MALMDVCAETVKAAAGALDGAPAFVADLADAGPGQGRPWSTPPMPSAVSTSW